MTLYQMRPNDRLNHNGQIHLYFGDEIDENGAIIKRIFKRYHDNKRVEFINDHILELYGAYNPGQILFYKLKYIK